MVVKFKASEKDPEEKIRSAVQSSNLNEELG